MNHSYIKNLNTSVDNVFNKLLPEGEGNIERIQAHFDMVTARVDHLTQSIANSQNIWLELDKRGVRRSVCMVVKGMIDFILINQPDLDRDLKFIEDLNLVQLVERGQHQFMIGFDALVEYADKRYLDVHPFAWFKAAVGRKHFQSTANEVFKDADGKLLINEPGSYVNDVMAGGLRSVKNELWTGEENQPSVNG